MPDGRPEERVAGASIPGLPKSETEGRVNAWLERLSIAHLGERPASNLSGGEAQRTSLARAMVVNPEVLFLDEPFAALDAPTRQSLLQEFKDVLADSGVTAVFATHDRGEAIGLGGRVAVLVRGGVAQVGSAETIFSRPENAEVARFVGMETLIPGHVTHVTNGSVRVAYGEIQLEVEGESEVGDEVYVAVRPEEIGFLEDQNTAVRAELNVVAGRVTRTLPAETHYRVEIDCGIPMVAVVSRARFRDMALEIGSTVHATFRAGGTSDSARGAHLIPLSGAPVVRENSTRKDRQFKDAVSPGD